MLRLEKNIVSFLHQILGIVSSCFCRVEPISLMKSNSWGCSHWLSVALATVWETQAIFPVYFHCWEQQWNENHGIITCLNWKDPREIVCLIFSWRNCSFEQFIDFSKVPCLLLPKSEPVLHSSDLCFYALLCFISCPGLPQPLYDQGWNGKFWSCAMTKATWKWEKDQIRGKWTDELSIVEGKEQ